MGQKGEQAGKGLQVWNVSQAKPLYATTEEVERYTQRINSGWLLLGLRSMPTLLFCLYRPVLKPKRWGEEEEEEEPDTESPSFFSKTGDLDLGLLSQKS